MKTDLSHLPNDKQDELSSIAETIHKAVPVEMIILFGSYARGDWVADRYTKDGVLYEYVSDIDLLIVIPAPKDKANGGSTHLWERVEEQVKAALPPGSRVNVIAHNIDFVNSRLAEGHWFFSDIVREGVVLFDSGRHSLAKARELPAAERLAQAEQRFAQWFESAQVFLSSSKRSSAASSPTGAELRHAAFELHQAAERFFTTALLVHTNYKPKSHDLDKLGKLAATQAPELIRVFPRATDEERRRFELLNEAYVDARYDPTYSISREDLEYLGDRVRDLRDLTEAACRRKIEGLRE